MRGREAIEQIFANAALKVEEHGEAKLRDDQGSAHIWVLSREKRGNLTGKTAG